MGPSPSRHLVAVGGPSREARISWLSSPIEVPDDLSHNTVPFPVIEFPNLSFELVLQDRLNIAEHDAAVMFQPVLR